MDNISALLDECLERLKRGESIDSCLDRFAHLRDRIEPLLFTAQRINPGRKAAPSDEFVQALEKRLLQRHREKQAARSVKGAAGVKSRTYKAALVYQNIKEAIIGRKRAAISSALAIILVAVIGLAAFNFLVQTPASASTCTLSVLSGSTAIKEPGSDDWQTGADGTVLAAGTRIKTPDDSHALLTFAGGSSVKLQPDTDIEIKQLEGDNEVTNTIVLRQSGGTTWSHVVKIPEVSLYYEIETPSASAVALGTLFTTEVSDTGLTRVITTEGTVKLRASGEEVDVPANLQAEVQAGEKPSIITAVLVPSSQISIKVDGTAAFSVIDSTGSSTGSLPDGLSFNQIPGAISSSLDGASTVTIPHPIDGRYKVVLRYRADGEADLQIQGLSEGMIAYEYSGTYTGTRESGWLIVFNIDVEDGNITGGEIVSQESLGSEMPEKVVKERSVKSKDSEEQQEKEKNQNAEEQQEKEKNQNAQEQQEKEKNQNAQEQQEKEKNQNAQEQQEKEKNQNAQEQQEKEKNQNAQEQQEKEKNKDDKEKQEKEKNQDNPSNQDKDKDKDKDNSSNKDKN